MKTNVYGIVSLICGIIGLMLACVFIGIFPAIVGIIMAIVAFCQKNTKYGTAIAGMICSVIGIGIFALMCFFATISSIEDTKANQNTETTQSTTVNSQEESLEQIVEEENLIDCEVLDCYIKYVSHEIGYDRSDNKCVFVYYQFANDSTEPREFYTTVSDMAFQNGIELESSIWKVEEYENNPYAEIKPGAEITVVCAYQIRDNSNVELEIRKAYDYNNKVVDSMIIELE